MLLPLDYIEMGNELQAIEPKLAELSRQITELENEADRSDGWKAKIRPLQQERDKLKARKILLKEGERAALFVGRKEDVAKHRAKKEAAEKALAKEIDLSLQLLSETLHRPKESLRPMVMRMLSIKTLQNAVDDARQAYDEAAKNAQAWAKENGFTAKHFV